MPTQIKSDQIKYVGRGPLDAKSLVSTYAELMDPDTWKQDTGTVAYNGMIVSVCFDKDVTTQTLNNKNGIYFLFDPLATTKIKKPDVTLASNWIKISDKVDTSAIEQLLNQHSSSIQTLEANYSELSNLVAEYSAELVNKVNKSEVYTKPEIDNKFESISTLIGEQTDALTILIGTDNGKSVREIASEVANNVKEEIIDLIPSIDIATEEKAGTIKSAPLSELDTFIDNAVYVADDGVASVHSVNVNSLVQTEGDILILDGSVVFHSL